MGANEKEMHTKKKIWAKMKSASWRGVSVIVHYKRFFFVVVVVAGIYFFFLVSFHYILVPAVDLLSHHVCAQLLLSFSTWLYQRRLRSDAMMLRFKDDCCSHCYKTGWKDVSAFSLSVSPSHWTFRHGPQSFQKAEQLVRGQYFIDTSIRNFHREIHRKVQEFSIDRFYFLNFPE